MLILIINGSWGSFLIMLGFFIAGIAMLRWYIKNIAIANILVITSDRFFWGNWQQEQVEEVFYYRNYNSLKIAGGEIIGIQEREVPKLVGRGTRIQEKRTSISLPVLFGPFEDRAPIIIDAYKRFHSLFGK